MKKNTEGFSIIIALFIIGFLLVLTISVFNLVLKELNDNRGLGNYMKAFAGAESAQELALLSIKTKGYAYYDKIDFTINNRSILLAKNPLTTSGFNTSRDPYISFDLSNKVDEYSGKITSIEHNIIPLFFLSGSSLSENKTNNIELSIDGGIPTDLNWNIIGDNSGISGVGAFNSGTNGNLKTINDVSGDQQFSFDDTTNISSFLSNSNYNYLVLFNSGTGDLEYTLKSNAGDFITPDTNIISSAKIGKYRQNISTYLDNTDYLNFLKYSIYSN